MATHNELFDKKSSGNTKLAAMHFSYKGLSVFLPLTTLTIKFTGQIYPYILWLDNIFNQWLGKILLPKKFSYNFLIVKSICKSDL